MTVLQCYTVGREDSPPQAQEQGGGHPGQVPHPPTKMGNVYTRQSDPSQSGTCMSMYVYYTTLQAIQSCELIRTLERSNLKGHQFIKVNDRQFKYYGQKYQLLNITRSHNIIRFTFKCLLTQGACLDVYVWKQLAVPHPPPTPPMMKNCILLLCFCSDHCEGHFQQAFLLSASLLLLYQF